MAHSARITRSLQRLRFLRGNTKLLLVWPIVALLISLVGWGSLLQRLDHERKTVETDIEKEALILARSHAERMAQTIEVIDQLLLHVRYEWELTNGQLRLDTVKEKHGLFPSNSFFNVAITDRDGVHVTSTYNEVEGLVVLDRAYFQVQRDSDIDSLYIDRLTLGRSSKKSVIHFSRRIVTKEGNFDGVVRASVSPEYLSGTYDAMLMGANDIVGILGTDKNLRAMRIGGKVYRWNEAPMRQLPVLQGGNGSTFLRGKDYFEDERNRYLGWYKVAQYPLFALSGLDEKDALAGYRTHQTAAVSQAIQNTIALALFTLIAMAMSVRLAWRKFQVSLSKAAYRIATEEGQEGFYILKPIPRKDDIITDYEVMDCNSNGARFFQKQPLDIAGKRISRLFRDAERRERAKQIFSQAMEVGAYESDIEIPRMDPEAPSWFHIRIVRSEDVLAITMRDISESKAHVAELERRGNHDALTGLPNRHWVNSYLPSAIDNARGMGCALAILFLDLDGFKKVNDTLGHEAGDDLLRHVGKRLKLAVRPRDHVIRIGGDEFVVITEKIYHSGDASHVASRVLHAFEEPFHLRQGMAYVGASIGISMFPSDGSDANSLLNNADIAMYSVKTSGKRNFRFFDQRFYDAIRAKHEKEAEIRHAVDHDQFVIYYQPRVDIATGITSSMEALVRWAHPTHGIVVPNEFIPMAEETGIIISLGKIVIEKVCAQMADWSKRGQELVPVSINVSPRQFNEGNIATILQEAIERHHVDPRLIEIEVTESSMMSENDEVTTKLHAIRQMGIKILVDDFGTGYSSLSQLQRLDFDVLKVDRTFTNELVTANEGRVLFQAIITMAHGLGMRVVAEGVETLEQIKLLKALRCDEIQGFYVSQPLPASDTQPILPKWFFPSTA